MERYSRLSQLLRGTPQELGCSEKLSTFLRQLGFMDLQPVYDVIDRELADFRDLTDCEALPPQERPMLLRYRPFSLADRPGWARDVVPFLALCAAGIDSSGAVCRHTYFFQSKLLQKAGEFQYLDYLFGTRFAIPSQTDADALQRVDFEQPPVRVEPLSREEDALLVKLAAAALLRKRPIVLKLEKNCAFNRRALELLSQIYSLLPPALAIQTGFSAYQDPRRLEELIQTSPIRIFLIHADCGCNAASPDYLYFDLNQPLNLQLASQQAKDFQVSKQLFTSLTYWHGMPWRERQPLMELLFADEKHLPNDQSYNTITRSFVREPFIQWINRMPDRGTVTSIAELKSHYDSFPICERVPILREKFRMAVPELLSGSLTLEALAEDLCSRIAAGNADPETLDRLKALSAFAQMLLSIPLTPAGPEAPAEAPRPAAAPRREDRPAPQAQPDSALQEELSRLTQEKETLRQEFEHRLKDMEQSFTTQYQTICTERDTLHRKYEDRLKDMEQSFASQYNTIFEENKTLRRECDEVRRSTEQEFQEYLELLSQEHSAALTEKDSALARKEAELLTMVEQCASVRQQLEEVKASMEQDLLRHRQSQVDLFDQLQAARKEHTLAQNAIDALKQSHAAALEELAELKTREADHAHTLNRLRQEHLEQLVHLRSEADAAGARALRLESELAQSAAAQREALERMRLEQEKQLADALDAERSALLQQHAEALTQLKREADQAAKAHAAELEKLEAEHISDLNRGRQEHTEQLKRLRGEADAAAAKALLLENKLAQSAAAQSEALEQAQKDLDRRLRDAVSELEQQHAASLAQLQSDADRAAKAHAAALEKLEEDHIFDLSRLHREHNDQLKRLRGETEAAEAKALLLENKLAQAERSREEALAQSRKDLERRFGEVLDAERETMQKQHAEALARQQREADQAAEAIRAELRELSDSQSSQVAQLKQAHAAALEKLEADHISDLNRTRQEHNDLLKRLRGEADAAETRAKLLENKLAQLERTQAQTLSRAREELERRSEASIAALEQQHADVLAQLKCDADQAARTHAAEVEKLETGHAAALAQLRQEHHDRLAQLESSLLEARQGLEHEQQKNARTQEAQKKQYIDAFNELRSNAAARINQLQQELAAAKAQSVHDDSAAAVEAERARLTAQHQQELDQVRAETLRNAESLFLRDRAQLQLDHEEALSRLRDEVQYRDDQLAVLRAQHRDSDQAREQELKDMIARINENNEKARQALLQKHQDELAALKAQHRDSDLAQEQKLRDLITKINENNEKARQALEQKHLDEIKQINKTNETLRQNLEISCAEQRWSLDRANRQIDELKKKLEEAQQTDSSGTPGTKRSRWW